MDICSVREPILITVSPMKALENSEIIILKRICNTLLISYETLVEVFLRIKVANKATYADLNKLQALKIPILESIFTLMKKRIIFQTTSPDSEISFEDIKTMLYALFERDGLLYRESDVAPRHVFSYAEAVEIKRLLRHAKGLGRMDRQYILSHLRINYRFFPSAITKSRIRFSDEAFDYFVATGTIKIA